jgi:hypothetical protein
VVYRDPFESIRRENPLGSDTDEKSVKQSGSSSHDLDSFSLQKTKRKRDSVVSGETKPGIKKRVLEVSSSSSLGCSIGKYLPQNILKKVEKKK